MPKWLRKLIIAAADVSGCLLSNVAGGAILSGLAWKVTGEKVFESSVTVSTPETINPYLYPGVALKPLKMEKAVFGPVNNVGVQHNDIINAALASDSLLLTKSTDEIINTVFEAATARTGVSYSKEDRAQMTNLVNEMISCYDPNKSISEYMGSLKSCTKDQTRREALDACSIVLEGMQYVDDSDTLYLAKVKHLVNTSTIKPDLKKMILRGVSVADGSAKLWNTEALNRGGN